MLETKITESTLQFLSSLKKNNNREWFAEHKDEFKKEEIKIKSFFEHVLEKLNTHDEIEKLKVFRIYRDVRFSKKKHPIRIIFQHLFPGQGNIGGEDTTCK